jgi:acyl carrier protein
VDDGRGPGSVTADSAVLLEVVRELVIDVRPAAAGAVGLDARLDADLGLDSLAVAELLVRVEERFGHTLPDAVLAGVETPGDLFRELTAAEHASEPMVGAASHRVVGAGAGGDTGGAVEDLEVADARRPATLRSIPATVYGLATLVVFALLAIVVYPVFVLLPGVERRWRLLRAAGRLLFGLTGVPVTVRGAEHLPSSGPIVVAANHASFLDPLCLAVVLPEPPVWVAVEGVAAHPLAGLFLRRLDAHLVGRGDRLRARADRRALTSMVRSGRSVAFFPEGRRTTARGLEPFRLGAFLVAADAGVPVVPIALRGTRRLLPVGARLPRWSRVTVTVEPAVESERTGWAGATELLHATRAAILRHCGEPDLA